MTDLRRYTELPYVLEMLRERKLTLLSPSSWDDKNDAHYLEAYRKHFNYGSVVALCLTSAVQTYHHWKVFTPGASGACVVFDKAGLLQWVDNEIKEIDARPVEYLTLSQLRKRHLMPGDLPFIKRKAYEHEQEVRLLHVSPAKGVKHKAFPLPLELINHILMNPWLPAATVASLQDLIQTIPGCETLDVFRATITHNDAWQQVATSAARRST